MENKFFKKYLKYKNKYLSIKQKLKQISGSNIDLISEGPDRIESDSLLSEELSISPKQEEKKKIISYTDLNSYEEYFKESKQLIYSITYFLLTKLQNYLIKGEPFNVGGYKNFFDCIKFFIKEIIKEILNYGLERKNELDTTLDLAVSPYLTDTTFLNPKNIDKIKSFIEDCKIQDFKELKESKDKFLRINFNFKNFKPNEEIPINWKKNEFQILSSINKPFVSDEIIPKYLINIIY